MNKTHLSSAIPAASLIAPLSALLAFERAASQLSFRRAARDLGVSPSAISHQIRSLEERFGTRLFARGGRTLRLTAAGERYLQSVSPALALLEEGGRDLLRQGRGGLSVLRISALPFFTSTVLIPALADFRRRNPRLTLHIEATHQYADFDSSGVDVAIRYGREHAAGLRLRPLLDVHSLPVCAPALARAGLRRPADLAGQVLIHVAPQPRAWTAWLAEAGLPALAPRGELWFDTLPAALEAAEHGLGVALAMHPLIEARPGFGTALVAPFDLPAPRMQTLFLVCRPEQARERKIVAFQRWLADALARATGDRRPPARRLTAPAP